MAVRDAIWNCLAAATAGDARDSLDTAGQRREEMVSHLELLAYAAELHGLTEVMQAAVERLEAGREEHRSGHRLRQVADADLRPLATALVALGDNRLERGESARAEALFRMAGDVYTRLDGPEASGLALTIARLARNYSCAGLHADAFEAATVALSIADRNGASDGARGPIVAELGAANEGLGRFAEAVAHLDESRRLLVGCDDVASYALTLRRLGAVEAKMGRLADARTHLRAAATIQAELPEDQLRYADTLSDFADLYMRLRHWRLASELYEHVLAIRRRELPDELQIQAQYPDGTITYFDPAGERREAVSTHPLTAEAITGLAVALLKSGRLGEAEALNDEATAILRRLSHPDLSASLHVGAHLRAIAGDFATAEQMWHEAIKLAQAGAGYSHPDLASMFGGLALMYAANRRLDQARAAARAGERIATAALGPQHADVAGHLATLAVVLARSGDRTAALTNLRNATRIDDQALWAVTAISSIEQRRIFVSGSDRYVDTFLSVVFADQPRASAADCAEVCNLVLRHKGLELESLLVRRDALVRRSDPDLDELARELHEARSDLARLALTGSGGRSREHDDAVFAAQARRNQAEEQLAERIPELDLGLEMRSVDVHRVAQALPPDTAFVEFMRVDLADLGPTGARYPQASGTPHYLAIGIAHDRAEPWAVLLSAAEEVDVNVASFREAIVTGESEVGVGVALRSQLVDPIEDLVGPSTKVVLAPDGDLFELPFDALPLDDGRRLVDRWEITYVSTGRDLLRQPTRAPAEHTAVYGAPVVVGDPDFDLSDGTDAATNPPPAFTVADLPFDPIEFTRREALWVADLVDAAALIGRSAVKCDVTAARSPRIIHLATHGYFLPADTDREDPDHGDPPGRRLPTDPLLRSGLLMAGARTWCRGGRPPARAGDGLLTAEDVADLDLRATEIAVLSACESGLGAVETGEGVHGLRRAFQLAGAGAVIMSLWQVGDETTESMIRDFYTSWLGGCPPVTALRAAQARVRETYPDRPSAWAAFICQQSAGPASSSPLHPVPGSRFTAVS